ncbi:MAG: serpin family protein [Chlorobi bacterium]|nr:serpin family protein [Chlorobiota bacterium]
MKLKNLFVVVLFFIVLSGAGFKCSDDTKISNNIIINANQQLAFNFYKQLKSEKGNLFYSPFSLSSALAMTYAGAKGETKNQMSTALYFNDDYEKVAKSFSLFNSTISNYNSTEISLEIANGIFADSNWKFLDSYFSFIKNNFDATIQNINMHDKQNATKIINEWSNEKTHGKIPEIINENDLDLARLILANSIYFKGIWKSKFNKEQTNKSNFFLNDNSRVEANFMFLSDTLKYWTDNDIQILEIPYAGEDLSMLILLPGEKNGFQNFENELTLENYNNWINSLKKQKIDIYLPKFKVKYEKEFKDILSNLGMPVAFSRMADFSGMTGKQDLQIDKVIHKSFIEVNEEGSEAAAVTAVVMREKSAALKKVFRANHPFVFIIKENLHNSILFMGRLENPAL